MSDLAPVLLVAAALVAIGCFGAAYRRDMFAVLAGLPVVAAGVLVALVGASRLASSVNDPVGGQEMAVLVALVALATVSAGIGLAAGEGSN